MLLTGQGEEVKWRASDAWVNMLERRVVDSGEAYAARTDNGNIDANVHGNNFRRESRAVHFFLWNACDAKVKDTMS